MDRLAIILRLKLVLSLRGLRRDPWRRVSIGIFLIALLPLECIWAVSLAENLITLWSPMRQELLHLLMTSVYMFWLMLPMVGMGSGDGYDISKLFVYPVGDLKLALTNILANLVDPVAVLMAPMLVAIWAATGENSMMSSLTLAVLALFAVHTVALGQALAAILISLLQSRRFRDVAIVVGIFAVFLTYLIIQNQGGGIGGGSSSLPAVLASGYSKLFAPLPCRLFSETLAQGLDGNWTAAGVFLGLSALATLGAVWLAGATIRRMYRAGHAATPHSARRRKRSAMRRGTSESGFLPPGALAMWRKECTYFVREPLLLIKMAAVVFVAALFWFLTAQLMREYDTDITYLRFPLWLTIATPVSLLEAVIAYNVFGGDGDGAVFLFCLPTSRKQMLIAKALFVFVLLAAVNVTGLLAYSFLFEAQVFAVPLALMAAVTTLVWAFAGLIVSVVMPQRIGVRTGRVTAQEGAAQGCGRIVIYLCFNAVFAVVLSPLGVLIMAPLIAGKPQLAVLSYPAAALYALFCCWGSLWASEAILKGRESEVAEAVSQSQ